jgi:hypothetical protein
MNILDSARQYISRGWCPIPIPYKEKGPKLKEWNKLRLTTATARDHFNGAPQNIGVLLGEPSGWLVDVDLDCEEARRIAPRVLAATARFGRAGSTNSHWLYRVPGAESCRYALRTPDGHMHTLIELRATNLQTVFPPSTHPSGEMICWEDDVIPTEISAENLSDAVLEAAVRCAFARFAPDALSQDARAEDGYPIDRLPEGIREQVQAWLGPADVEPPSRAPQMHVHTSYAEAVRRYNSDHQQTYPRCNGECPVCHDTRSFGYLPETPSRWACFSTDHDRIGVKGNGCWHGDQLDLDAHAAGKTRTILLRDSGYLEAPTHERAPTDDTEPPPYDLPPLEDQNEPVVDRPKIFSKRGTGHNAIRDAMRYLSDACPIFQRGGRLVSVARGRMTKVDKDGRAAPDSFGVRRSAAMPMIIPMSRGRLWEMLSEAIHWQRFDGRSNDVVDADPPDKVVDSIHSRGDWPEIPILRGLATTPVLRADGSICVTPGYDVETSLYYAPRTVLPQIPSHPTLDDARAAVATLLDVVCDVPFLSAAGRSAWLATVLARVGWSAFDGNAPLTIFDATTPGIGKSKLADVSSVISTGGVAARSPWVREDDELRKRILSHLLAGDQIALIDNVPSGASVGWPSLDSLLTSDEWNDRELGHSGMVRLPNDTMWMITGNNLGVVGDASRRMIRIRLESNCEHPEERSGFKHEPWIPCVMHLRPRLLAAALMILRGFILAGKPNPGLTAIGNYEGWSDLVRASLVWTGEADPAEERVSHADSMDEAASARIGLLANWHLFGARTTRMTTAEIINALAYDTCGDLARLRECLEVLCPPKDGHAFGSRQMGRALRSLVGRPHNVEGELLALRNEPTRTGVMRWHVGKIAATTNESETQQTNPAK